MNTTLLHVPGVRGHGKHSNHNHPTFANGGWRLAVGGPSGWSLGGGMGFLKDPPALRTTFSPTTRVALP